jgi:UDP-N-acetylmuramoyl-tripeptide--D-alanyl-D-alanine ligase
VSALWTAAEIAEAVTGEAHGDFTASGVAFDSREVGPGDFFIALKGEATDGHRFLDQAFASGAAGALVSQDIDSPHVRVDDTMAALNDLGRAARARSDARIVGVTGSVGKTSVKEALFAALDRAAPGAAHRSVKSYNNHTGVPLSLARMPCETRFGVFEMGMNRAGELADLTRLVRPHVAVVTAIASAHREFFASEEAIADAKGEIFQGLEEGGIAVIPEDSRQRDRLVRAARGHAERVVTFGLSVGAFFRWEFNSFEVIVRDGVCWPIDFANATPDMALISLHYYFPWAVCALAKWSLYCAVTGRAMQGSDVWRSHSRTVRRERNDSPSRPSDPHLPPHPKEQTS